MFKTKKINGFSLVEILIVVAVIGVLLTVMAVALSSKQKEIRDMKRVSDIQALRNSLEVVKNETGSYERAYCQLGFVSLCAKQETSELNRYLLNLARLNDPSVLNISCEKKITCQEQTCNYTFTKLEADSYEVRFHLENGGEGFQGEGCYSATATGIKKLN